MGVDPTQQQRAQRIHAQRDVGVIGCGHAHDAGGVATQHEAPGSSPIGPEVIGDLKHHIHRHPVAPGGQGGGGVQDAHEQKVTQLPGGQCPRIIKPPQQGVVNGNLGGHAHGQVHVQQIPPQCGMGAGGGRHHLAHRHRHAIAGRCHPVHGISPGIVAVGFGHHHLVVAAALPHLGIAQHHRPPRRTA